MDELLKESKQHLDKIQMLESFISLHLRQDQLTTEINELKEMTERIKNLIIDCNQVMKIDYENGMREQKAVIRKMQEQQLQVLSILTEKRKSEMENENLRYSGSRTPRGVLKENQNGNHLSVATVQRVMKGEIGTPKMYIGEYAQSPFVKKVKPVPVPFQFLDFEVQITPEMFESIPRYMRGRETLDELINFLDTILVPCFNEKYQLLHRHRNFIRNSADLDLWRVYKDQAAYFPGQNFITQGDISRKIKKMLDKKSQNKITMLRHLGILQEQRKAQTVCYIWTTNNVQG